MASPSRRLSDSPVRVAEQQRWLVTGASRGIGRAIAERAAQTGAKVAGLARSNASGEDEGGILSLTADVTDDDSVAAAVEELAGNWGGIDVVINNAGLHRGGLVERIASDDFSSVLATNVSGPLNVVRACLPHIPEEGGSIVNIGAVVGMRGFAGDVAYGTSKAALAGMTRVLAVELARRSVRVNLVIPGFVSTEMTADVPEKARDRIVAEIPLGREGTPAEIAEVVWWVAQSPYMTGSTIATDGGLMAKL